MICGPTASGKTAFAIEVALAFSGEIVGADSMQIYRYMDVGTAKPTPEERSKVHHHMIDVADPDEPFDAEKYASSARRVIEGLHSGKHLPVVAGGTGLYIKALTQGLFTMPRIDSDIRKGLKAIAEQKGISALHDRLQRQDPASAARIHRNDVHRILRALEVYEHTGKPLSELQQIHRFSDRPFRVNKIGLRMERERLYQRIDRRTDRMIDAGLLDEVRGLVERGYAPELKSMQSIGYRHMCDYLLGRITWEEAVRTLKRDTRRYAKRQMTWFRADPEIRWMDPEDLSSAISLVKQFLTDL